ncbi:MAG: pentapeptide repeat-containing protein [Cyanobacteriota bacterium]|nr:pentapeptide repeat-containing protein [Cyanobacteriota bacterium]
MTGDSSIKVERPRSPLRKDIKINPKGLFLSLSKAAINGAFLKWDDLAESGVEVLESLGLERKSGEIAGLLVVRALLQAMKDLLDDNSLLLVEEPKNLNLKGLYEALNAALEDGEVEISSDFFLRPQDLPFLESAQTSFAQWLAPYVENPVEAQNMSCRLPAYFVFALNEEWKARKQDYLRLQEELDTPFTQASERERGWLRYRAWLQKQVEEPMFLESFSLKQVYVSLRAYYQREIEGESEGIRERRIADEKRYERVVVDLNSELETWLQEAKAEDAIRLMSGGPGIGKSSFAKMFAARQAEKGEIPVLLIPLHLFKLSDDLVKAVGEFVQIEGFLRDNPLDRENGEQRLLIVFDGLDELSMQGKVAAEAARQFIEEVREKVNQFNYHQMRLQVLISGREVVVQANRGKFRKPHQLLYLLPYFVPKAERESEESNYADEQNLLEDDRRQLWWQLYGQAKGKPYDGLPPELDRKNLVEITTQPLLNYLVALSIELGQLQFTEETNLNEIYGDLLESIYERGYEKYRRHRATEEIEKEEFVGILEEIALACWHGDGRTTTVKEIEAHCENSGMREILRRFQESFQEDSKACVTRLLIAFYFWESGGFREGEKTFEFTHKSFGEYLTAKRIVEGIRKIYHELEYWKKNWRKSYDERQALIDWATLCGVSEMDEYLFGFVAAEICLKDVEEVRCWQKMLCSLIEVMLVNGMPMEGLKERPNFQEEMRRARNAEEALLVVLNACARVTKELSKINWPAPEAFGAWLSRLHGQRISGEKALALQCLSFLDLSNAVLLYKDLSRANLNGANLSDANLNGANLSDANLNGASLRGASLRGTDIDGASLREANLEQANLKQANLKQANLKQANLERANLERANLDETILTGASLRGANLEGANLKWAYLEGTILEGQDIDLITASSEESELE